MAASPRSRKARPRPIQTVAFVSLGCPKNLVDSEKMLGLLAEDGLMPIADHHQADAIVINTCGFLEASKAESLHEIAQAAQLKKAGSCQRLIVAGCLVQRHRARMLDWCPDIDALIGVFDRDRIVQAVRGQRPRQQDLAADVPVYSSIAANAAVAKRQRGIVDKGYFESDAARLRLTPRHYAYLRISEGCNQNCAFCTIPSIRGKMRSKPLPALLAEARELLADGVFELNLIGQDTTSFGADIAYAPGLAGMLRELAALTASHLPGGGWLRLMYAYPSCFTDDMIAALADLPNVVKYIDMPLQHIDDRVLDAMRRKTSRSLIEKLLDKLRARVPGIALRTTFITGFPGETDAQHRRLVKFVRDFGFEAMGVFPYSPEPGTPAGALHASGKAIPDEVIQARLDELMRTQQDLAFARAKRLAAEGREFDVLIDALAQSQPSPSPASMEEPAVPHTPRPRSRPRPRPRKAASVDGGRVPVKGTLHVGRTYQQAPQIDSVTYVMSRQPLAPGEVVRCRVTDADGYDLIAQPVTDLQRQFSLPVMRS